MTSVTYFQWKELWGFTQTSLWWPWYQPHSGLKFILETYSSWILTPAVNYIMYMNDGNCPGGIFLAEVCHFFSTLMADYEHFLHFDTCFNWLPWSIMSTGLGKLKLKLPEFRSFYPISEVGAHIHFLLNFRQNFHQFWRKFWWFEFSPNFSLILVTFLVNWRN